MATARTPSGPSQQAPASGVRIDLPNGTVIHRDEKDRDLCGRCEQLHCEVGLLCFCRIWRSDEPLRTDGGRHLRWQECLDVEEVLVHQPTPTG
ncbi:MAG: hypothetical protein RBU45_25390 [Myxococcota bacterium]|jgi:hypothetical protein|nr:hypothetical protein [Myxococcota bacterium]